MIINVDVTTLFQRQRIRVIDDSPLSFRLVRSRVGICQCRRELRQNLRLCWRKVGGIGRRVAVTMGKH